jgi:preprotein translocase subunit SecA
MLATIIKTVFGSRNDRLIKAYSRIVSQISALEPTIVTLSDEELKEKTSFFKSEIDKGRTLESIKIEAFAVCREAANRTLQMRHFDVQLIGGMALFDGKISEMRTGEGKTLVATLPAYLSALSGRGVHIVTVNDYLAKRDAEWMGKIFKFLGLSVGVTVSGMNQQEKKEAYKCDITYGTNNEFGFDYLRDNMVTDCDQKVQRDLFFAIVDEVDSILIDEARTPLIISGQSDDQVDLYNKLNDIPMNLKKQEVEEGEGDYFIDEKGRQINLSDSGFERAENLLEEKGLLDSGQSLYDPSNIALLHHLVAALKAHNLFEKDQHYVIQNNSVVIVDEFTGRLMPGRRWSEGIHQAIEAKESVQIESENQTLASITFQNYFRMYENLSGMTGTADTEAFEFKQIYDLETLIVPTHKPMVRKDHQDQIYRSVEEKFEAVVFDIKERHSKGQPVLVGTTSIENSEQLSSHLTDSKVKHQVLNAKQHEMEADIVAQAGRPGMVTIATNMAGRGTDIVLGGNITSLMKAIEEEKTIKPSEQKVKIDKLKSDWMLENKKVIEAGGLHIIGTERHESRRIDNQLRGRAGRQGDPGSSRFYLAMDDSLLRIFAGEKMKTIMDKLGVPKGEPIEAGMVSRSIESAQRKVENRNFDIRKQLLEFDNVSNEQRKILYQQRKEVLESESLEELVSSLRKGSISSCVREFIPQDSMEEQWNLKDLSESLRQYGLDLNLKELVEEKVELNDEELSDLICEEADVLYKKKLQITGKDIFRSFERAVLLQTIDIGWREHLSALDHLRQGIHLRGYAQKDPKQEYKREAFQLFEAFIENVRNEVTKLLMAVEVDQAEQIADEIAEDLNNKNLDDLQFGHEEFKESNSGKGADGEITRNKSKDPKSTNLEKTPYKRQVPKVGRNEPCPCGSEKKYKHCHGRLS